MKLPSFRALAGVAGAATALSFGLAAHGVVGHAADSIFECNQHNGGHQVALLVNHNSGAITAFAGTTTSSTIQAAVSGALTDVTAPTSTGSGAGDTVIVCQGTYTGNLTIGQGNDNLTVRSEEGPNNTTIVGDGAAPVVTIDDRGLSFGGPAEGLTISLNNTSSNTSFTGIQLGVPGGQPNTNEDEQCMSANATVSGCDQAAPADVTINDQVIDNDFSNFRGVTSADSVVGIKLDNTINSVVQQNALLNVIPDHSSVASFEGIVIGGFNESPAAGSGFNTGDSTNINTALFQNTIANVFQGGNSTCASGGRVEGIELNGFMLDSQVYNNWLQQLYQNSASCSVTGIFSNAYGSLENEQTGTLAPVNANIDNNTLQQLGPGNGTNSSGIVLAPTPASATPAPTTTTPCTQTPSPNCDRYPPSSYTVVQNEIQQVHLALHDEAVLGSNSFIRFNNFDNAVIGVENDATAATANTALDATNNWWGCELPGASAPPSSAAGNNHGCAALINSGGGATSWAPPQTQRVEGAGDDAGNNAGNS